MAAAAVDREDYDPTPYADLAGGPYYDLVLRHYPENRILLDLAFWRRSRGSIFFNKGLYSRYEVSQIVDLYDGAILYTDDNLGRILKALADLGLAENTVVAVMAITERLLESGCRSPDLRSTMKCGCPSPPRAGRGAGGPSRSRCVSWTRELLDLAGVALRRHRAGLRPLLGGGSLPMHGAGRSGRRSFRNKTKSTFQDTGNRMVRTDRWKLIQIRAPGTSTALRPRGRSGRGNRFARISPGEAAKLQPLLKRGWPRPLRDGESSGEGAWRSWTLGAGAIEALGYIRRLAYC
jgi:hypothetical protein